MKNFRVITIGIAVIGSSLASGSMASQVTDAFYANIKPSVVFLDKSSRLAVEKTAKRSLRDYAQNVATRETIVENTLVAWWQTNTSAGAADALGKTPDSFDSKAPVSIDKIIGGLTSGVANVTSGKFLTGRSVAVDQEPHRSPSPPREMLPAQASDFDQLQELHGSRFDAFFKVTQRNTLRQLLAVYRDYAASGDDPALRQLADLQRDKTIELINELNALD